GVLSSYHDRDAGGVRGARARPLCVAARHQPKSEPAAHALAHRSAVPGDHHHHAHGVSNRSWPLTFPRLTKPRPGLGCGPVGAKCSSTNSMVVLNKIYTRTGDDGSTALGSGERVSKSAPRVAAYGTVDETNAMIGLARAWLGEQHAGVDIKLARIQ